jgi:hypothetical protein
LGRDLRIRAIANIDRGRAKEAADPEGFGSGQAQTQAANDCQESVGVFDYAAAGTSAYLQKLK